MIKFLLNNKPHTLNNIDPNTTVLNYLRESLHKTGTKEGCASGDCGACTVVIGELHKGRIRYRNINACIALVVSLHGKQLITVEDLKNGEQLHPVQQAMIDSHGSQCGFCTPGFVMSMFALRKNSSAPNRRNIEKALAGNLCRCTGYKPIIDAAVNMYSVPMDDQFTTQEANTIAYLQKIQQQAPAEIKHNDKRYFAPTTSAELADLFLRCPNARLLAGGTDLSLEITQALKSFDTIIYIGGITDMQQIEETSTSYRIGAAVTYSDCSDIIEHHYSDFGEVIERLGSMPIRNVGTIGGNIGNASPIADMPPGLIALGAKIYLRKGNSERVIPLENYFIDYKITDLQESEFIHSIEIPKPQANTYFKMYKISKRIDDDISASCAAFTIKITEGTIDDAQIAFGGLAEIPKRAKNCEAALIDKPWNQTTVDQAMACLDQDFTPLSDARASASYRMQVSKNLLQKCFLEIEDTSINSRVTHYA